MTGELEHLKDWVGRTEMRDDIIAVDRVAAMAATLDHETVSVAGEALPPGWHWLFFNPAVRAAEIGPDGHPKRGGFLPPVPLPRRMWAAGGRLPRSSTCPDDARRESEPRPSRLGYAKTRAAAGRCCSSPCATASAAEGGWVAIDEEHDIVYRPPTDAKAALERPDPRRPDDDTWRWESAADLSALFRYSALTFNGHRIHYDHPYVRAEEGYPSLIVHGPLIATLLIDLVERERPGALQHFAFRAISPLFDTTPFSVHGSPAGDGASARLWAAGQAVAQRPCATPTWPAIKQIVIVFQ